MYSPPRCQKDIYADPTAGSEDDDDEDTKKLAAVETEEDGSSSSVSDKKRGNNFIFELNKKVGMMVVRWFIF